MQNIIRIEDIKSQDFWTVRKLRRGCSLNTMLFYVYVQELEEDMEKRQIGGVVICKNNSGLLRR